MVRYNGGPNAGHTVVIHGEKFKFHLFPSGRLANKLIVVVLAGGMVIDPIILSQEIAFIAGMEGKKIETTDLIISDRAHCIMPWHIAADIKKGGKIGTTRKGVGPCYADKSHRSNAIRMGDLLKAMQNEKLKRFFAADCILHGDELWEKYIAAVEYLAPYIQDEREFLREAVKTKRDILFESANGIHLDVDHGTYPFVTSSGVGPAAIPQACGLPNLHLDRIVGVIKCHSTRVGEGPFPSEVVDPVAHQIREKGKEYGTTTGRPRRIGWFDVEKTIEAVNLTGAMEVALMHADTLADMHKVGYCYGGGDMEILDGWSDEEVYTLKNISGAPLQGTKLLSFVTKIEKDLGIPITMISYGPDRSEMIYRDEHGRRIMHHSCV